MPTAFNSEPADEPLKGDQRLMHLEKEEPGSGRRYLESIISFLPGRKVSETQVYRPDGSLSYHWTYHYEDDQLTLVKTFLDGALCQQELHRPVQGNTEEVISRDSNGRDHTRTITTRDATCRVIESTLVEIPEDTQASLVCTYDELGQLIGATCTHNRTPELNMTIEITRNEAGTEKQTIHWQTGTTLTIDHSEFKVLSRDHAGNWIVKATPLGIFYRTIEYYDSQP